MCRRRRVAFCDKLIHARSSVRRRPSRQRRTARRLQILQRTEHESDPLPSDAEAARIVGRIGAAVSAIGRTPRSRVADLTIAAVAAANKLPHDTTNPADVIGLLGIVDVVPVSRPPRATDP